MGSMAAAINKFGQDAVESVLFMLQELEHRGADTIQIATPTSKVMAKSLQELKKKKIFSSIAVGHNSSRPFPEESQPVILKKDYALAFEGHLFPPSETSDTDAVARVLESEPQNHRGARPVRSLSTLYRGKRDNLRTGIRAQSIMDAWNQAH
jgi:hypothetical protein